MVNYKTRVFFEPDTNSLGADVIIYSETGEVIDTILVTTESKYNELAEQIQGLDDTYINTERLSEILANVQNELEINATKFDGYEINNFAMSNHTHSENAPRRHSSSTTEYGLGTPSVYGHNKVINNLTSTYHEGESLAAAQGKVLKDFIDSTNEAVDGINVAVFNNPTSHATACKIALKKVGSIVFGYYHIAFKSPSTANLNKDLKVSNVDIPAGFRPLYKAYYSVAEYNSNNNMLLFIDTDGKIYCRGYKQTIVNVYGTCFWFTDIEIE